MTGRKTAPRSAREATHATCRPQAIGDHDANWRFTSTPLPSHFADLELHDLWLRSFADAPWREPWTSEPASRPNLSEQYQKGRDAYTYSIGSISVRAIFD